MKKSVNTKLLEDVSINSNEKLLLSVYIKKQCIIETDVLKSLTGSASRNDVIEKAIAFFFAYTTSQISQDYLCGVFGAKMEGLVGNLASRISKSNFRNAVESDMTNRMLSTVFEIDRYKYDKLRAKAIHDVKRTNGSIDILEAVKESESDDLSD